MATVSYPWRGGFVESGTPEYDEMKRIKAQNAEDRNTKRLAQIEADGWTNYKSNPNSRGTAVDPYGWNLFSPMTQSMYRDAYESGRPAPATFYGGTENHGSIWDTPYSGGAARQPGGVRPQAGMVQTNQSSQPKIPGIVDDIFNQGQDIANRMGQDGGGDGTGAGGGGPYGIPGGGGSGGGGGGTGGGAGGAGAGTGGSAGGGILNYNTNVNMPGVGDAPYDDGGDYETITTGEQVDGMTQQNADGSVSPGTVDPTTREVQDNELVANQMSGLLNSDSKFIQDARRQGLEQSNAMGGLGGTAAVGASMQAAMRSALPIATADADAFRQAATQNMDALNQFAQLNHQRATQLELGNMDAKSRLKVTQIGASVQMAQARLQAITQKDISMLDNTTKLRVTEMNGQIQKRLADDQFTYSSLLNDQMGVINMGLEQVRGEYGLANTGLAGEYSFEQSQASDAARVALGQQELALQRENAYTGHALGLWDRYLNDIKDLTADMDNNARSKAIAKINQGFMDGIAFLNSLYQDIPPIDFASGMTQP